MCFSGTAILATLCYSGNLKYANLDILSVQIGARPVPRKNNVFCPCFSFQILCFCALFVNFIYLPVAQFSFVHLSVHGQR